MFRKKNFKKNFKKILQKNFKKCSKKFQNFLTPKKIRKKLFQKIKNPKIYEVDCVRQPWVEWINCLMRK